MKYFYGAAVQGIQRFIFQTNKLKEIVGASELVEQICTMLFRDVVNQSGVMFVDENLIIGAAGNIKYIFESKEDCQYVVRLFPKIVMEYAPGITISQAVVEIDGELKSKHFNAVEDNLKKQRNILSTPIYRGQMIAERSRRTGMPGYKYEKDEVVDFGTFQKQQVTENCNLSLDRKIDLKPGLRLPYDFEEMADQANKNWMAVIHADGNGLGKILQKMGAKLDGKSETELKSAFRSFSKALDQSTINATRSAITKTFQSEKSKRGYRELLPFRPIVLGGDDLTIITRAEDALDFVHVFFKEFEEETAKNITPVLEKIEMPFQKLTVCAGISFIKTSYPFHYGYQLAERLCEQAKKDARQIDDESAPSCVLFYKVQSSYTSSYEELVSRELTCVENLSLENGPYYLIAQSGKTTVEQLKYKAEKLTEKGAPASQLRRWLTERYVSKSSAQMLMERTIQVLNEDNQRRKYIEIFDLRNPERENKTDIYDIGTIASLIKKKDN